LKKNYSVICNWFLSLIQIWFPNRKFIWNRKIVSIPTKTRISAQKKNKYLSNRYLFVFTLMSDFMAYNFFSSFNLFRNEFSWEMKTLSTENTESPINFNFNPKQSIANTISFYCYITIWLAMSFFRIVVQNKLKTCVSMHFSGFFHFLSTASVMLKWWQFLFHNFLSFLKKWLSFAYTCHAVKLSFGSEDLVFNVRWELFSIFIPFSIELFYSQLL
jgi:hypothetical protein